MVVLSRSLFVATCVVRGPVSLSRSSPSWLSCAVFAASAGVLPLRGRLRGGPSKGAPRLPHPPGRSPGRGQRAHRAGGPSGRISPPCPDSHLRTHGAARVYAFTVGDARSVLDARTGMTDEAAVAQVPSPPRSGRLRTPSAQHVGPPSPRPWRGSIGSLLGLDECASAGRVQMMRVRGRIDANVRTGIQGLSCSGT